MNNQIYTGKRVMIIAPHPDDETLGVGGTIAKYSAMGAEIFVLIVSGHLPPLYSLEDYDKTIIEARSAFELLGVSQSDFLEIPATMIDELPHREVNDRISKIVNKFAPHIVFVPIQIGILITV
jgi:N-acetylglucosamine malate deacetylase 1